jgi:hypothetical protein
LLIPSAQKNNAETTNNQQSDNAAMRRDGGSEKKNEEYEEAIRTAPSARRRSGAMRCSVETPGDEGCVWPSSGLGGILEEMRGEVKMVAC